MKTKTQHTPGPWKTQWNGRHLIQTRGGWLVATLCAPKAKGGFEPENIEANARLIAAAPDLLAALSFAEEYLSSPAFIALHGDTASKKARAAIAKALGKS